MLKLVKLLLPKLLLPGRSFSLLVLVGREGGNQIYEGVSLHFNKYTKMSNK